MSRLRVLTVLLTIIIELCWYPGSLFTIPTDNVEVCEQVERDLNKKLKAEQCQDAEVNIRQLSCEGLVGEFLSVVWHFLWHTGELWLWWRQDQMPLQKKLKSSLLFRPSALAGWLVLTKHELGGKISAAATVPDCNYWNVSVYYVWVWVGSSYINLSKPVWVVQVM